MVDKVLFWGKVFEFKILMDSEALKFSDSENQLIFSDWSLSFSVVSITQKQIIKEIPHLAFYICIINK